MADHITPEELRRVRKALMYAADRAPGNLLLRAAATIEALQAENEQLRERQGSHDLANEAIRWKRRALNAETERDGLAATLEQVRAWLAYKPTASLHDIVAAAPSVSLAHVKAETLREAAEDMAAVIHNGDVAECAAFVPGESGRSAAVEARDSIYEEPAEWLAKYADQIESEASNE